LRIEIHNLVWSIFYDWRRPGGAVQNQALVDFLLGFVELGVEIWFGYAVLTLRRRIGEKVLKERNHREGFVLGGRMLEYGFEWR
jgi:hypothetical protein